MPARASVKHVTPRVFGWSGGDVSVLLRLSERSVGSSRTSYFTQHQHHRQLLDPVHKMPQRGRGRATRERCCCSDGYCSSGLPTLSSARQWLLYCGHRPKFTQYPHAQSDGHVLASWLPTRKSRGETLATVRRPSQRVKCKVNCLVSAQKTVFCYRRSAARLRN